MFHYIQCLIAVERIQSRVPIGHITTLGSLQQMTTACRSSLTTTKHQGRLDSARQARHNRGTLTA